jgi:glucose-1-phosphatase
LIFKEISVTIRAVIFDLGGVILRTNDYSGRRKWEAKLGLQTGDAERAVFDSEASRLAQLGKRSEADVWQSVADQFKLNDAELEEFQKDFWLGDCADPVLVTFIRGLRPRFKTAILSNAWPNARATIQRHHLLDAVDDIVVSAEEGMMKPDARIYQLTAERVGVQLSEAMFVDDMPANVQGARAAGMSSVQFDLKTFGNTAKFIQHLEQLL